MRNDDEQTDRTEQTNGAGLICSADNEGFDGIEALHFDGAALHLYRRTIERHLNRILRIAQRLGILGTDPAPTDDLRALWNAAASALERFDPELDKDSLAAAGSLVIEIHDANQAGQQGGARSLEKLLPRFELENLIERMALLDEYLGDWADAMQTDVDDRVLEAYYRAIATERPGGGASNG